MKKLLRYNKTNVNKLSGSGTETDYDRLTKRRQISGRYVGVGISDRSLSIAIIPTLVSWEIISNMHMHLCMLVNQSLYAYRLHTLCFFFPAKETAVKPLLSNDALSTDTSLPELSRSGRGKGSDQADSERVATDWARAVPVRSAPLNSKQ